MPREAAVGTWQLAEQPVLCRGQNQDLCRRQHSSIDLGITQPTHPCTICSRWLPTFCPASSTNMTVSLLAFWVASPAAVCSALRDALLSSGLLSRMASRMCSYFTTLDCSRWGSSGLQ